MQNSKIHHCTVIKKIFIILGLLFYFFFCRKGLAWPQDAFEATLTFDRIDSDCKVDELKQNKIKFGFDNNCEIIYSPPPPPGPVKYCLKAFIDPNRTTVDGDKLNCNPEYGVEWYKAILPYPEQRACWGIKVLLGDSNNPESASLKLIWNPNELGSGLFKLVRGKYDVLLDNMKDNSEIILNGVESSEMIRIEYYNKSFCSNPSVLAIICVGGREDVEGVYKGQFENFFNIGDEAYNCLSHLIPKNNIRYIFYDLHDVDGNREYDDVDPDRSISQKKRLKKYITEWPMERWPGCLPKSLVLIIYIADHGILGNDPNTNPYIYIDPISFDPNNPDEKYLFPEDLDNWLNELEDNLLSHGIYKFEIITIIEACYSNRFLDTLWDTGINCYPMKSNLSNKIFITSAEEKANVSYEGKESFSWHFWEGIKRATKEGPNEVPSYLRYAFNRAEFQVSDQSPRFEYCYNPNKFLFDNFDECIDIPKAPYIKKITVDSDDLNPNNSILSSPSLLTFILDIDFDPNIRKVWAIIEPPNCSNKSCRKFVERKDTNIYELDGNQCIFQPNYLFCCPGRYKIYFYAEGENNGISNPKPYFLDVNAPPFLDIYEPDNELKDATAFYEEFQIHSFHDTNDTDWIKFPAIFGEKYDISFDLLCVHPTDPNTAPFQVILTTDGEEEILTLRINDDYSYIVAWDNHIHQKPIFAYLKIIPIIEFQNHIPYKISIKIATAEVYAYIIGKVEEGHGNIIDDLYIFNESNQKCYPNWIYDFITSQPEYFIFNCSFDSSSILRWGLGGEDLGPVDSSYPPIFINPEPLPLPDPNKFPIDDDCDGIMDEHDPDANQLDIILHPGLNLFRYPLWTGFPGADLNKIFYNPNVINPDDSDKIKGIRIFSDQKSKWYYYDQNSSEIYLPDKSGCLIHLDSKTDLRIPLTSAFNLNKWGTCLKDLDTNKLSYYSKMDLDSGLNLVSFIGYKVYFVDYPDPDNPEICFDFCIPSEVGLNSYSVIHSLSGPASFNQLKDPNFTIMRHDNLAGKWESSYSFFGRASGKRNNIKINEAYIIYSKEQRDAWLPVHKLYKSY